MYNTKLRNKILNIKIDNFKGGNDFKDQKHAKEIITWIDQLVALPYIYLSI